MNRECPARFAPDFDLAAGDCAIAQHTNALIVERMPFPAQIGCLEDREFIFRKDRLNHVWKRADYNGEDLNLYRHEG